MLALLEKTRMINKLLQNTETVSYKKMAEVLKDVIKANIYIVSSDGELLGYSILDGFECELMIKKVLDVGRFPADYVKWLEGIRETSSNYRLVKNMCAFSEGTKCLFESKYTTVVPIFGNGVRLGTLILGKFKKEFVDSDLLLSEYAATVIGMQLLHDKAMHIEEASRKKAMVQIAFSNLSYSELEAISEICYNRRYGKQFRLTALCGIALKVMMRYGAVFHCSQKTVSPADRAASHKM